MPGHFRSSVWDPVLVSAKIVTIQCVYYVCLGFWLFIVDFIAGAHNTLDQVFSYQDLQFTDITGKLVMGAFVLNTLCCAVGLWRVVKRTKQCLDFTVTAHLFHLLICWIYNGSLPSVSWWCLNIICIILMTVSGEFLCMRSELKAIPLMGPKADL